MTIPFLSKYLARKRRATAQAAYDRAAARRDTRSMHHAKRRLKAAVNDCLRVGA